MHAPRPSGRYRQGKAACLAQQKAGGDLDIKVVAGVDFPEDLSGYKLILHCGGCMFNRKQFLTRLIRATEQNVPITNYGTAIAELNGILDRTTELLL